MTNAKRITNPLTIIAIFAGITEVMCTGALAFVSNTYEIWIVIFLVFFSFILVLLFFITLYFNHKVLYAPSDYTDEANFMLASNLGKLSKPEGIALHTAKKIKNE